ncbi:uncharacterized protein PHACADRAFT_264395 [Phanerochaete carnosa HHB-10118-sp]|uniref:AB hydrolase-1 domain-containing protein n=1 Tax=Phanerochaete carnosa (strain HHB-10118-sp) TaxID=650164 RepID=K5WI83_PHACS|nr:uncharacterized protein PHACADRAFT_264395 [Phanerochaete carnosa HHB-10118-sp]EKM49942.1 hypothetical protein PHACADRAFT_264395 [Phanerochaete carnosa HHB-10118-sp]
MPVAQIDDNGTSIHYEDSGAPHGYSKYGTLVFTHGAMVNSAIFDRMLPYASKYGLRIITMNNRDYHGSTPYTDEELAHLTNPDVEVQAYAMRRWGRELALFLAYVCQTLHIPAVASDGAKEGGLVLVAWSMGGIAAVSILGDPRTMGSDLTTTLAPYLSKVVLFDSPPGVFGVYPDIGFTWPMADPTIPPELKADAFISWVSSYYTSPPDGIPITAESMHEHYTTLQRMPTLRTLSPEDYQRIVELEPSTRSSGSMLTVDMAIHRKHAHGTFFDADAVLPNADLLYLFCEQTMWTSIWSAKVVQDLIGKAADPGKKKRDVSFLRVKDANHFVQWDEPERMVRLFAESCYNSL